MTCKNLTPRYEAYAFRMWAELRKGPATLHEVADTLDIPVSSAYEVIRLKGWTNQFRDGRQDRDTFRRPHMIDALDEMQ